MDTMCFLPLFGRAWLGLAAGSVLWASAVAAPEDDLEDRFAHPPVESRPWCYWYWISNNVSREGITKDLEAMAEVGIGTALIGNQWFADMEEGGVPILGEEWWKLTEHAIREGGRVGVDIGLFNCPGWSQSGGPWVEPSQAMRYLAAGEVRVQGPAEWSGVIAAPGEDFQDVTTFAFPVPAGDGGRLSDAAITATPPERIAAGRDPAAMLDGNRRSIFAFPATVRTEPLVITLQAKEPFTARSLTLHANPGDFLMQCELQAGGEDGWRTVTTFTFDRRNPKTNVGPTPHAPVVATFNTVTAKQYRLIGTGIEGGGGNFAELELSGAARVEKVVEKSLGKVHPTPTPAWDAYLWRQPVEPEEGGTVVAPERVVDLSGRMGKDGRIAWDVPEGEWVVVRMGMLPTGTTNAPAAPNATGLETDKMNRAAIAAHYDSFIGEVVKRIPAGERTAFKYVVADSYETGPQNWTDGFGDLFEKTCGYDPGPWLPVLTGRVVGSADRSERFLWDLRRLVADRVGIDYVGGLRDLCAADGLEMWLENYGHWGFPGEFLQYGGNTHRMGGEFWTTGNLGTIELRAASSAAHTYGRRVAYAEAFTSGDFFKWHPRSMKARGEWAFSDGVNHFVLHVYIQQPREDAVPGVNAWFGTEFNRHNTWFYPGRSWIDYLRRCHVMLQEGEHVADVLYYIGDDAPKMTGVRDPELPAGYDFDYVNGEVIRERMEVRDGRYVLPGGKSYRMLVLPKLDTMRPEVLEKIVALVGEGGTVLGPPPERSPSMEDYPAADRRVRQLAGRLWPVDGEPGPSGLPVGKGRSFGGDDLKSALQAIKVPADVDAIPAGDVLWTHRRSADREVYFLTNQTAETLDLDPVFRVEGMVPELWDPVTGERFATALFRPVFEGTQVSLRLDPHDSVFVVFSGKLAGPFVQKVDPREAAKTVRFARTGDGIAAEGFADGEYRLWMTDGGMREVVLEGVPAPVTVEGPWELRFPANRDVPAMLNFEKLLSWTEHENVAVRHFSGTAAYRKSLVVSPDRLGDGKRLYLDLGQAEVMAEVILNGRSLGVLWHPPLQVDVTDAVRAGTNDLEVRVTNLWRNRIVGDMLYPERFPGQEGPKEFQTQLSVAGNARPQGPLDASGLLGPVVLRSSLVRRAGGH